AVLMAGDLVAYATGDNGLSVANWRTGSLLYHLERPDLDPYQVALGADGTVVALLGDTSLDACGRATVFDPLNTSGRELPQRICELSPRLIGRQVAFMTGGFSRWSMAIADIDTGAERTVARLAGKGFGGFDFD